MIILLMLLKKNLNLFVIDYCEELNCKTTYKIIRMPKLFFIYNPWMTKVK